MLTQGWIAPTEERGSIPMALLGLMIVSMAVATVVAAIVAGERQTRFDSRYEASLQTAEVGADEFISRLKNPSHAPAACAADPSQLCLTGAAGSGTYDVVGAKDTDGTWEITSRGIVGETTRTVVIRLEAQQPFKYALFGDQNVSFEGVSRITASFDSDSATWGTINGAVAGNQGGNITGVVDSWDPAVDIDVASDDAVAFITDALDGCTFVDPTTLTFPLVPGDYCVNNLVLDEVKDLDGASLDTPVRFFVTGNISVGRNASINCGMSNEGCSWGSATMPNPGGLQIYSLGQGQVTFDHSARIAAAIYAPRAHCTSMPHVQVFGSLVCRAAGQFTGHFRLYYDDTLKEIYGPERRLWSEEPNA